MDKPYQQIMTLNPTIRSGKPTIRGVRITVYDVLSYLAAGMSVAFMYCRVLRGPYPLPGWPIGFS